MGDVHPIGSLDEVSGSRRSGMFNGTPSRLETNLLEERVPLPRVLDFKRQRGTDRNGHLGPSRHGKRDTTTVNSLTIIILYICGMLILEYVIHASF